MNAISERTFVINVYYEGPWERLASRLWGLRDGEIIRVVRDGSLRDRLACWADRRDRLWAYKYALRNADPHPRWKRRCLPRDEGG